MRSKQHPENIGRIARRYGIKSRGFEAMVLAVRKIEAVIAQGNADLRWLQEHARQLDALVGGVDHSPRQEAAANKSLITALDLAMPEIIHEIDTERKINAIKLYRHASGLSLSESKDAVEAIARRRHDGKTSNAEH